MDRQPIISAKDVESTFSLRARERGDRIPEAEAAALRAMSPDDRAAFLRLTRQYRLLFEQQLRTLSSQGGTPPDPAAQQ